MDLHTATLLFPRAQASAWPDQVVVDTKLGLLGVADPDVHDARGRAAARMALDTVRNHVRRHEDVVRRFIARPVPELRTEVLGVLQEAVQRAAQETFAFVRRGEPMHVTLDAVLALDHEAFVVHVGDGRVYLCRRGLVHQLTTDHREEQTGPIADPEAPPRRRVRALGPAPRVRTESLCMELAPADRLVVLAAAVPRVVPETTLHKTLVDAPTDDLGEAIADLAGTVSVAAVLAQLPGRAAPTRREGAERLALLAPMPLFAHCTELELRSVAAATVPRRYKSGTPLFLQGDPGTELYLLVQGEVDIESEQGVLATLEPGTAFGEMALLDEPARSATARASTHVEALVIPREAFFRLLRGNPPLAVKILWNMLLVLSKRLRRTSGDLALLREQLGLTGE